MADETAFYIIQAAFYIITVGTIAYNLPWLVLIFVFFPLCLKVYNRLTVGWCRSLRRLDGKTVIVTGANVGCGFETAKDLARRGARVILACRSVDKAKEAQEIIKRETKNDNVIVKQLDLSSFASIRKFAAEINAEEPRLDILINNAGVVMDKKVLTVDKLETDFQSNHCGPFLLTNLLLDLLRKTGNARIVNLTSDLHKFVWNLDFDNLNSEKDFHPMKAYPKTKAENILFTKELHRRLRAEGITDITVNAVHPGVVRTALKRNMGGGIHRTIINAIHDQIMKSSVEGAQTTVHVAVSEEVEGVSGEYFEDCKSSWHTPLSKDPEIAKKLWEHTAKIVNLKPDETIFKSKST